MNARQLSQEIHDTLAILERLQTSLEAARAQSDPFAMFVYTERRQFKNINDFDRTKDARHCQKFIRDSFGRARERGWRGDYTAWGHVLKAYIPTVAPTEGT